MKKVTIENTKQADYTYGTVRIVSLVDAKVKITGTVTGNLYVFERAGTVLDIDTRDKNELLNKKRGKVCCGGVTGSDLFQLE